MTSSDGLSRKKQKRGGKNSLSDLKILGQQLLSSRANVNNLPILLSFISPSSPPHYALESLLSLQSFFTPLLPELPSSAFSKTSSDSNADPEFIYRTWLRSKFDDLVQSLIEVSISSQSEDTLREVVLETIMEFVKVGNGGKFHSAIYHKLLHSIVHSTLTVGDSLLDLLASKYFNYIDVRYFTYIILEKLARTLEAKDKKGISGIYNGSQSITSVEHSTHKIHNLLSHIPSLEASEENSEYEMWNGLGIFIEKSNIKGHIDLEDKRTKSKKSSDKVLSESNIAKKMKLKFTKAWISFLQLPLPLDVYKEVLVTLHQNVIPHLSKPIMLCDFLTRSYNIGGVVSVMALSSLYVLMTKHGLEYPDFYDKLYALLEPSIFMAKHRAKFFQLLDSCLKSPLLPAYLAAAFCKKLSRLALCVPPSGALVIVALVHNLLQRHPSINCLVHQERSRETTEEASGEEKHNVDDEENSSANGDSSVKKSGIDHFNNEESNPKETNAIRSSLWEFDTLRHHYCPPVSRFFLSFENDLAVRGKTAEIAVKDFSSGSYATIFNNEMRRRVKQVPLAFYKATPSCLFSESDFPGWTFRLKDEDLISLNQ
ncbi:nucleolar complex 4 homolog [Olea europaea subsp. europaea]|uniref:Nucleolar complex 4 homolog n=1 Tax=Olea europaea subsp. europaea TaxID=158383 RepID=A0A8S0QHS5_OLEEU|nr:nucleolar complex 4 homolog [Olea europaea subsp. europaea]